MLGKNMLSGIRNTQKLFNEFEKEVKGTKSKQIYQESIRNKAKEIVDTYFRNVRNTVVVSTVFNGVLKKCDLEMHNLLEASHKRSTVGIYKALIKKIKCLLIDLEKIVLLEGTGKRRANKINKTDAMILETLKGLTPSAASSYEQALTDLQNQERLSWRGPATDLRESLRECLDHLAPSIDVKSEPGFKFEPNTNSPTMKQKVRFILKKRGFSKNAIKPPEDAVKIIDEIFSGFVRNVYSRASISTHVASSKEEVIRILDWVRIAFCEILEIRKG